MREITCFLVTGLLFGVLIGCGGGSSNANKEPIQLALEDFAQFLKNLPSDGVKPPKNMQEFIPLEPMAPMASEGLANGELVYFWGTDLRDGGDRIIAHQKSADANGGWVLQESGKVVRMTQEEFQKAPKAK